MARKIFFSKIRCVQEKKKTMYFESVSIDFSELNLMLYQNGDLLFIMFFPPNTLFSCHCFEELYSFALIRKIELLSKHKKKSFVRFIDVTKISCASFDLVILNTYD